MWSVSFYIFVTDLDLEVDLENLTLKSFEAISPRLCIIESRLVAHYEGLVAGLCIVYLHLTLTFKLTLRI